VIPGTLAEFREYVTAQLGGPEILVMAPKVSRADALARRRLLG
jgi:hypothetical protein